MSHSISHKNEVQELIERTEQLSYMYVEYYKRAVKVDLGDQITYMAVKDNIHEKA